MDTNFDTCPYCGRKILKGAMKCLGCGRILKTPEEQKETIEKLRKSKKSFNIGRLLKFIVLLLAVGIIYYYFSDQIVVFIERVLGE
jgi:DNA-directed RNA polymerase subunit RPC12/RpoP